jgi:hypothetical protein
MFSFDWPQAVVSGYLVLTVTGTPVLRFSMMRKGVGGFVSWNEFWKTWSVDAALKLALVMCLYFGGFW